MKDFKQDLLIGLHYGCTAGIWCCVFGTVAGLVVGTGIFAGIVTGIIPKKAVPIKEVVESEVK